MNKVLQSVALTLIALLGVQPALASMTCTQQICGPGPFAADCCLSSNHAQMPGDAAMQSMTMVQQASSPFTQAGVSCNSGSCCAVSSVATPKLVSSTKFSVAGSVTFMPLRGLSTVVVPVRAAVAIGDSGASASARYILFQVFRI